MIDSPASTQGLSLLAEESMQNSSADTTASTLGMTWRQH